MGAAHAASRTGGAFLTRIGRHVCNGYGCRKKIEVDMYRHDGRFFYMWADRPVVVTDREYREDWYIIGDIKQTEMEI